MSYVSILPARRAQSPLFARAVATLGFLVARQRTRRALGERLDDAYALADVGLSVEQARRECAKWFWM